MSDFQTLDTSTWGRASSPAERNRVLRNTYWLLALSLLPTVLGAWLGVATGITASLSGGLGLIVFLGGAFGFMYAIEKTKDSATGVPVLLGFTFFMGLMLSRILQVALGFSNGGSMIAMAAGGIFGASASFSATAASIATVPAKGVGRSPDSQISAGARRNRVNEWDQPVELVMVARQIALPSGAGCNMP